MALKSSYGSTMDYGMLRMTQGWANMKQRVVLTMGLKGGSIQSEFRLPANYSQ